MPAKPLPVSRRRSAGVSGQRGFRLSCDRVRVKDMLARGPSRGPRDATPLSLSRRDGSCPGRIEGHPRVRSAPRCPQRRAPRAAGAVRDPADQCQAQRSFRGLERRSPAAGFDQARGESNTRRPRPNAARVPDRRAPSRPRIVTLYTSDEPSLVDVVLGATSISDLIDRMEVADRVSSSEAGIVQNVADLRERLRDRRERLQKSLQAERALVAELQRKRMAIQSELDRRQSLLDSIRAEVVQLKAKERARERALAAQARARIAAEQRAHLAQLARARIDLEQAAASPAYRCSELRACSFGGGCPDDVGLPDAATCCYGIADLGNPRSSRGCADCAPLPGHSLPVGWRLARDGIRLLGVRHVRLCADRDLTSPLRGGAVRDGRICLACATPAWRPGLLRPTGSRGHLHRRRPVRPCAAHR